MIMNDRQQVGYESEFGSFPIYYLSHCKSQICPTTEAGKFSRKLELPYWRKKEVLITYLVFSMSEMSIQGYLVG